MRRPSVRSQRGFTLLEMLLVVIIIAILGNYSNYAVQAISGSKMQRARSDAAFFAQAIYGPESRNENGFLAEIGRLPNMANVNAELAFANSSTFAPTANYHGMTYGWSGPYALPGADQLALVNDPWGRPWVLRTSLDGRICSSGPNMIDEGGTNDDVCSPAAPPMPNGPSGILNVYVVDKTGMALQQSDLQSIVVWGANPTSSPAGQLTSVNMSWSPQGYFTRNNLVMGRHVVEVAGATGSLYDGARGYAMPWVGAGNVSVVTVRLRN